MATSGTALTLTARWRLLADQRFPLARAELPAQLDELGYMTLAADLAATIRGAPALPNLPGPSRLPTGFSAPYRQGWNGLPDPMPHER